MILFNKLSDYTKYRILEIIPGFLVWTTFIAAILLSIFNPIWALYFIIVFDLYWLIRITYLLTYLLISYGRFRKDVKIDWLYKLKKISDWGKIYHLIILPTYKEEIEILRTSFKALIKINYPLDKLIVVLACEERDKERAFRNSEMIKKEYGDNFFKFLVTFHPKDIPGEVAGKGTNTTWAARRAKEVIDELNSSDEFKIPYENIIVSSFDVDSCVHPQYFSYLTYKFLTHPDPLHTSFQPVPLYNNNIWDSPALMRVVANSTTFWLMTEQARSERLFTFSSHSMSFKTLVEVDFWQTDIVTEDSRIFLQCFLEYNGNYTVTPLYIPISMDTVVGKNTWQSLMNQYKQQRRWAWGIEHFPWMIWHFKGNKKIPFSKKFRYLWILSEGMYSWATAPILIFVLGRLPLILAGKEVKTTVLAQNAPFILEKLMIAAMIGIFVAAITSLILLPTRPKRIQKGKILVMLLQWIVVPFTMIVFGSIPATDAQTRLMLGKYLGFHVTEKMRK